MPRKTTFTPSLLVTASFTNFTTNCLINVEVFDIGHRSTQLKSAKKREQLRTLLRQLTRDEWFALHIKSKRKNAYAVWIGVHSFNKKVLKVFVEWNVGNELKLEKTFTPLSMHFIATWNVSKISKVFKIVKN